MPQKQPSSVIHITRASEGHIGNEIFHGSTFDNLQSILRDGKIKSSGHEGYIAGTTRATCFTENILIKPLIEFVEKRNKEDL